MITVFNLHTLSPASAAPPQACLAPFCLAYILSPPIRLGFTLYQRMGLASLAMQLLVKCGSHSDISCLEKCPL